MSTGITMGNVFGEYVLGPSLTPASVATITTATQTFTVPGLKTGDMVNVCPPSQTVGVTLAAARVSAADTLALTFVNPTAGSLTPAAGVYQVQVTRPSGGIAASTIAD